MEAKTSTMAPIASSADNKRSVAPIVDDEDEVSTFIYIR